MATTEWELAGNLSRLADWVSEGHSHVGGFEQGDKRRTLPDGCPELPVCSGGRACWAGARQSLRRHWVGENGVSLQHG